MEDGFIQFEQFSDSDCHEWVVTWDRADEPQQRTTTLAAMAWYAYNFDDEASVERC